VKQSIKRLRDMEQMVQDGSIEKLSKKEQLNFQREMVKAGPQPRRHQGNERIAGRAVRGGRGLQKGAITEPTSSASRWSGWWTPHPPTAWTTLFGQRRCQPRGAPVRARIAEAILEGRSQMFQQIRQRRIRGGGQFEEQAPA